jgi:hypothetical protein
MRSITLLTALVLLMAGSAAAQTASRSVFSAGWRFYHVEEENFAKGWYADIARTISARDATPMFAIVGEVGGSYKNFDETLTISGFSVRGSADASIHTFLGGLRVRAGGSPRVMPFGQVLFGAARSKASLEVTASPLPSNLNVSDTQSSTDAAFALDGGVDLGFGGLVGVRVAAGYLRVFGDSDSNAFRASAGVVIPF